MSKISLEPNASGAGTFSIVSPDSNTNRTLTLGDESGTIRVSETLKPEIVNDIESRQNNFAQMPQVSGNVLIENGSNSNGKYVRLGDGTQICWSTPYEWTGEFDSGPRTWTYPISFSGDDPVLLGAPGTRINTSADDTENVHFGIGGNYRANTTSAEVYHLSTRGQDFASTVFAIGRWF